MNIFLDFSKENVVCVNFFSAVMKMAYICLKITMPLLEYLIDTVLMLHVLYHRGDEGHIIKCK